jgi:Fur family ferric uptake transcriptional regulator
MERNTRQRDAIRGAFEEADRPLSVQEAHALATRSVRGLGIATVYRSIKSFLEEDMLEVVELPGEPPRYELTGKDHHHHFRCRRCDRVFDIAGCSGSLQSKLPKGFRVETHEVILYGRCAACA